MTGPELPATMTAARLHERGGPERIVVEQAPIPVAGPDDTLVAVHATAITPSELGWAPTWTRPDGSPRVPVIPGHEVAGVIAAVGRNVDDAIIGRAVFGLTDFFRDGAAAEYVAVKAGDLAAWPDGIDAHTAAALPLSGLTAWQALFDRGELQAGQRVLIHGAAGGVGTFAVQLARWRKAHVIAIASAPDAGLLQELGSDEVVDRDAAAFEEVVTNVDLVIDTVGGETLERSWQVLKPAGRIVSIAPTARAISQRDRRGRFFVVAADREELKQLAWLVERGKLRAIVDRTFPLAEAREAYVFGQTEHPRGKIVLDVAS
jgi:NADPH:quinone reductase-like Zn-dependent oxidoreductase